MKEIRLGRMGRIAGLGTVYAADNGHVVTMKSRDFDFVNWKHDDTERPTLDVCDGVYVVKPDGVSTTKMIEGLMKILTHTKRERRLKRRR